jgi:hypothetical protein
MTFQPGDRVRILKDRLPPIKGPPRIGEVGVVREARRWPYLNIDVELNGRCYWFDESELSRVVAWP